MTVNMSKYKKMPLLLLTQMLTNKNNNVYLHATILKKN